MARRSSRIQELTENNKLSCMRGLFSILESCQDHPRHKLISNGRRINKQVIGNARKVEELASFDGECRRIQNEAGRRSITVDATSKSVRDFIEEDAHIDEHRSKQSIVKRLKEHTKMDSELDRIVKAQKRARKSSEKAHQPSSCCLNNAGSLIRQLPSTSAEISFNKLTLSAILEVACARHHEEENNVSEYFQRSINPGNCDQVDETNIQQVQVRAKAFLDQMYFDREFICKEGMRSESKSFPDSLQALNSNKDLFKDVYHSQTEKETVKSVLDDNFSECEGFDSRRNKWKKSDKIVILKPTTRNTKHPENVDCHCSSLHFHNKAGRRVADAKTTSFSFREMKKKLKNTFHSSRKERNQFVTVGTSDKLSQDRSAVRAGDECVYRGVDIRNSFDSSINAEQMGKLFKKQGLEYNTVSGTACLTDRAHKQFDLSSARFCNKEEFDVILEAKRHLSARLKNLNSLESVTSKRSPRTLGRVLSSPEHDFRPISPRRESQYCSAQMRLGPHNTSARATESSSGIPNGKEQDSLSPLRSNKEVTSCNYHNKHDGTLGARVTDVSTAANVKPNGEPEILEMNRILRPELLISEEVPNEIKNTSQIAGTIKSEKDDGISVNSAFNSLSENEANTFTMDDFPSTRSSIYQLDAAHNIKYQEEHRSPVSVLETFFIEDADSPPCMMLQTAKKQLQPRRLDFEECSLESIQSIPQDPSISANFCIEEDHLSQYVQSVLQASCLNRDRLSQIRSPPEELLHPSLFDEVELPPLDRRYDPKLLFDHINEVLLEIYEYNFYPPPWRALPRPRIRPVTLVELVLDEIMTQADFYLLPRTERRTLDQLVSKDVAKCRSWLDVRLDTEQVVTEISDDFLEESILDIVLEFCT